MKFPKLTYSQSNLIQNAVEESQSESAMRDPLSEMGESDFTQDQKVVSINDYIMTGRELKQLNALTLVNQNPYACTDGGCLARAFNTYSLLDKKRDKQNLFPNEKELKESLNYQSFKGYFNRKEQTFYQFINKERSPVTNKRTVNWLESIPHVKYNLENTMHNYIDTSPGSWDIHGYILDAGGNNIYATNKEKTNKLSFDKKEELNNLYKQMTIGTIVTFGERGLKGYNAKYGIPSSNHSTIVVAFTPTGIPILYDYEKFTPLDSGNYRYQLEELTAISIPKATQGKTFQFLKDNNLLYAEMPKSVNADASEAYKEGNIDEMKPFFETLSNLEFKSRIMEDFNLTNKEYDTAVKNLVGISLQESKGGNTPEYRISKMTGVVFGDTHGLTQLNIENIYGDYLLKDIVNNYTEILPPKYKAKVGKDGRLSSEDLMDPQISAVMSMLNYQRNRNISKEYYNQGKKPSVRTYKPERIVSIEDHAKQLVRSIMGAQPTINKERFVADEGVVKFYKEYTQGQSSEAIRGIKLPKSIEEIQYELDKLQKGKYTAVKSNGQIHVRKKTQGNVDLTEEERSILSWQSMTGLATGDIQKSAKNGQRRFKNKYIRQVQDFQKLIKQLDK